MALSLRSLPSLAHPEADLRLSTPETPCAQGLTIRTVLVQD